jgi:hypothetical protein
MENLMKTSPINYFHNTNNPKNSLLIAVTIFILIVLACEPSPEKAVYLNGTPTPRIIKPEIQFHKESSVPICNDEITPGLTSQSDLNSVLGTPISIESGQGVETRYYLSSDKKLFHTIKLVDGVVVFVSVIVENEKNIMPLTLLLKEYGDPETILFSHFAKGSVTYVYASTGQSFIVSTKLDEIYVRTCFMPMSLDEFLDTWGANLPTEDPFT